jgi:hypothetical protein
MLLEVGFRLARIPLELKTHQTRASLT